LNCRGIRPPNRRTGPFRPESKGIHRRLGKRIRAPDEAGGRGKEVRDALICPLLWAFVIQGSGGRSEHAVLIQVYAALLAFLLLQLFGEDLYGLGKVIRCLLMRVRSLLFTPASEEEIVAYLAAIDSN